MVQDFQSQNCCDSPLDTSTLFPLHGASALNLENASIASERDEVKDMIDSTIDGNINVDDCKNELSNLRISMDWAHTQMIQRIVPLIFADIENEILKQGATGQGKVPVIISVKHFLTPTIKICQLWLIMAQILGVPLFPLK